MTITRGVKCRVCGEKGSAERMDLDSTGKCFYCRKEEKAKLD